MLLNVLTSECPCRQMMQAAARKHWLPTHRKANTLLDQAVYPPAVRGGLQLAHEWQEKEKTRLLSGVFFNRAGNSI